MNISVATARLPHGLRIVLPGIAAAAALGLVASWVAGGLGDPLARNPVLVAMLLGLLIGNCFGYQEQLRPGLDFTKRRLLRLAVVLVGFRITVRLFVDLGPAPLFIAAIELIVVLAVLYWIAYRVLRLDRELALLLAVGSAVCGAAAILSVAAITRARDQNAGIAIALITLSGTLALLLYPVAFLGGWLPGLDDRFYGVFVGASIYELAQVYGASFAISEGALNTATLVKLSKVLMLVPLLLVFGIWAARRTPGSTAESIQFPWFIVG
ncbi:MAG TPA: putative sulfate exporter family transporter, partial [Herpetosiphonaceae bacterium]|nr:putative sulfate exporter family transporter [Herpetosiphonaceae bacterium]